MSGWDRIAPAYDALLAPLEIVFKPFRRAAARQVGPGRVLEIGSGTGANFCCLPAGANGVAVDASLGMLVRAQRRSDRPRRVRLVVADAEQLPFRTASFDNALAALVLCNVSSPSAALAETLRIVKPGGAFIAFEHVRPEVPPFGIIIDLLNVFTSRLFNEHFNRRTVQAIAAAGFAIDSVRRAPMLRLVRAHAPER